MEAKQTRKSLRAAELISKYLQGTITSAEQAELDKWADSTEGSSQFMREITDAKLLEEGTDILARTSTEQKWEQLLDRMIDKEKGMGRKVRWTTWMNAAVVLIIAVTCWLLIPRDVVTDRTARTLPTLKSTMPELPNKYGDDVQPGTYKALLITGDGVMTNLVRDKDITLKKGDENIFTIANMLVFGPNNSNVPMGWNTLRTANGAEYAVTLPDGTKVWLNAASSVKFPSRFEGKERRVELVGEAFFEVAKNKAMPFIVVTNKMNVEALGTAFNVNSYTRKDSATVTTLKEGSIRVTTKFSTVVVKPGEQVKTDLNSTKVTTTDVDLVMAWKNGFFKFEHSPFTEVLEQISRWYDVKIVYDQQFKEPKFFTGDIQRNVPLSKILQMIEMTGIATFNIQKNTITILPYQQ